MGMRVLIVDDEDLSRMELAQLLRRVTDVDRLDEASAAADALARIQENRYDLVFLDIRMPGLNGLDAMGLVNRLPNAPPVVFVTAYDEHALAAFEVAARDYLLKPVSEARLRLAVERIRSQKPVVTRSQNPARARLAIEQGDHTKLIRIADIRYVHVQGHTVYVRTFDAEYSSRASLTELAERLGPHSFVRVHRSYLVNPEHVIEVHPFFAGTYILRVDDKTKSQVPVSRAYARQVLELFRL
ncbi:LytR/AlgR family response regulator transcription factor [Limnochorda pilosa]|uniref:LytTR family transcriptional regulator n=1 Tax=Limnochorda pilosa TaxID=1555112 RepID=A0A0K2SQG1_LIMPI|nr:LytTR family DNA-binding domain-containing protein [Limnochorda pilosa]BAS29232.1 LytTR family transcriptional regulator [Limnochorda pilosa]